MKPDLDPCDIERLRALHEKQLRDTQKLFGPGRVVDRSSYDERLSFEDFLDAIADLGMRVLEVAFLALVIILVICLSIPPGPTP